MAFTRARSPLHFANQPRSIRRGINLDLSDESFDAVVAYAVQTNPDGSFADSLRELLLAAVASDVQSSVVQSARRQAKNEARRIAQESLSRALTQISHDLELNGIDGSVEPVNGALTFETENDHV